MPLAPRITHNTAIAAATMASVLTVWGLKGTFVVKRWEEARRGKNDKQGRGFERRARMGNSPPGGLFRKLHLKEHSAGHGLRPFYRPITLFRK